MTVNVIVDPPWRGRNITAYAHDEEPMANLVLNRKTGAVILPPQIGEEKLPALMEVIARVMRDRGI